MNVRPAWAKLFPASATASLLLISGLSSVAGVLTVILGVYVFRDYGIALFCGTPFVMGFATPLLHGMGARRSFLQLFAAAVLSQAFLFAGMLIFGIEGIFCIIMAAPLWMTIATVGSLIAYPIHRYLWRNQDPSVGRGFPIVGLLLLALVPSWMGAEHIAAPQPPLLMVTTSIDIDAPPVVVWHNVLSFPNLPEPGWDRGGWLFHAGIARPIRAEITGTGLTAIRWCVFSTGCAVEPVRTWNENRLLELDVISTPPSMEETSLYPNLRPAHLEGYMQSARARFELIPLPGNRTRVVGTSWYSNRMFPVAYWQLWSDAAIKAVQVHVLDHIKNLSEHDRQIQE